MLWFMRDNYKDYRESNDFTMSLYCIMDSLIALDGSLYRPYGDFNEKERVQIIRAFTTWALEQEEKE
ncbi:hypothetical protein [Listeria rocourtiae]|nr:hypothetical protein [Listeria rocourtiae]